MNINKIRSMGRWVLRELNLFSLYGYVCFTCFRCFLRFEDYNNLTQTFHRTMGRSQRWAGFEPGTIKTTVQSAYHMARKSYLYKRVKEIIIFINNAIIWETNDIEIHFDV